MLLLLMVTYAPNLYRVFLTYGHDAVNKVCTYHAVCVVNCALCGVVGVVGGVWCVVCGV